MLVRIQSREPTIRESSNGRTNISEILNAGSIPESRARNSQQVICVVMSNLAIKPRKKRSKIWEISKEELVQVTSVSQSLNAILTHFGFCNQAGVYKILKARLAEEHISINHINLGLGANKGRSFNGKGQPLSEILVEHSAYNNRASLKKRLLKEGLLFNHCYICKCPPQWNSMLLSLQLDHINGISDDHRINNLRLLCPNCHSQTENFSGRNKFHKT